MDKPLEQNDEMEKSKGQGILSRIKSSITSAGENIKGDGRALALDLAVFTVGFILSRCQLLLGARPLGIAFVAMLPTAVWPALTGATIGALSLGRDGIIFAVAVVITAMLRLAVSASDKNGAVLFNETLLLRISLSVLSGFVVGVYEVLMRGLNEASMLFGLVMVILTPILTFILSGICNTGISLNDLVTGGNDLLKLSTAERQKKYDRIFFQASALSLIFFISLSLKPVSIFGISLSYVFSGIATLTVAKRFGAIRGLAVGFISSLGLSGPLSVAFALAGLCAGVMAGFGSGYAIIAGGVALCAWSAYADGLNGLLTTLPEYLIASALAMPMLKQSREQPKEESADTSTDDLAQDMVGTMALAYQNEYVGSLGSVESTLADISGVINRHARAPVHLTKEECRDIVINVAQGHCAGCSQVGLCAREDVRPVIKNAERISAVLAEGKRLSGEDINSDTEFCASAKEIAEEINREISRIEQESYLMQNSTGAIEYDLISRLICQARSDDLEEKTVDNRMTGALTEAFQGCGFENGVIRVFGNRRKHFILAGEDESGTKISSFELRKSIENASEVRLGTPEYFRRGKMVLMECGIKRKYKVSFATAAAPGNDKEASGDTISCFESEDDYFYSLISDGMGSGEVAKETSEFVSEFINSAVRSGKVKDPMLHMLNHSIRSTREECSATVDLFELDLLNGNGSFFKSGATPSYIKRESSIFRIKSQTAPLGLLQSTDTEKTKVEIRAGDHIIMLSDGISQSTEDAPWLLLLLGEEIPRGLDEFAKRILCEAKKCSTSRDDMSVCVIRIDEE